VAPIGGLEPRRQALRHVDTNPDGFRLGLVGIRRIYEQHGSLAFPEAPPFTILSASFRLRGV
jgi:hypothetical protein